MSFRQAEEVESPVADLAQVLGAPLDAAIRADFQAARTFFELVRRFGFVEPVTAEDGSTDPAAGNENLGELRMLTFCYQRKKLDGSSERVTVDIPALSLIPLPLLQIEAAEFQFEVQLLERARWIQKRGEVLDLSRKEEELGGKWRARFSRRTGDSAVAARALDRPNLEVRMKVAEADLPTGVGTLLNIMNETVCQTVTGEQ